MGRWAVYSILSSGSDGVDLLAVGSFNLKQTEAQVLSSGNGVWPYLKQNEAQVLFSG